METTVDLAKELIKFNTENPPADTRAISKFIGNLLENKSIKYKLLNNKKSVYLISEIGHGTKNIVLYAHSDVVVAGDIKKWSSNPYLPKIKSGRLYGRGSSDMKGGLAAAISAFIDLSEHKKELKGKLQLLICPEEEDYDSTKPLSKIIKRTNATACIMGEPHFDDIIIGEKGEIDVKLKVFGSSSHGSTPASGIDANVILDKFIHELKDEIIHLNKKINVRKEFRNFLKFSTIAISDEFALKGKQRENFISSNPAGNITINVGYYKSGRNFNIVPDEAEAHMIIMVPYGIDYTSITSFISNNSRKYGNKIKIVQMEGNNATLTDKSEKLVSSISNAYKFIKKKDPKLVFDTGSTDAVFYRKLNVPTVLYGPGYFFNAHTYNEYVSIKELDLSREIYKKTILNYLS